MLTKLFVFLSCNMGDIFIIVASLFEWSQLEGVRRDDLEFCAAFFAPHGFAFVHFIFNIEGIVAFRTYHSHEGLRTGA